ncbi:MAG: ferrous iron transporter B, partial [Gammaproteobacteria bacterium]|nr:ferrous iron transporter B [Gammaproteobacteria bacterium]
AAESQGVEETTLTRMAALFGSQFAAFCYLVFVLLYAPCIAVLAAIAKEAGLKWMLLTFVWTTGLAYVTASCLYQLGSIVSDPKFSLMWIGVCLVLGTIAIRLLRMIGVRKHPENLIGVVQT